MRIKELVNNAEFSFNFPFRILKYAGDEDDMDKTVLMYDSESPEEMPDDVADRWISAINEGDDGVMEIEYVRLIGEE